MEKILTDEKEIAMHKKMLIKKARTLGWKNLFMYECGVVDKYTKVFVEAVRNFRIPLNECTVIQQGIIVNLRDTEYDSILEYRIYDGSGKVWRGFFETDNHSDKFIKVMNKNTIGGLNCAHKNYMYNLSAKKDKSITKIPFTVCLLYSGFEKSDSLTSEVIRHIVDTLVCTGLFFAGFSLNAKLFIVEEKSASQAKSKGKKKCENKSIYRIMHVSDIRKCYIRKAEQNGSKIKVGFERRRHKHTFRSDRFVNMKGKTIWYPSVWVGPKTAIVGDRLITVHTEISCDKE